MPNPAAPKLVTDPLELLVVVAVCLCDWPFWFDPLKDWPPTLLPDDVVANTLPLLLLLLLWLPLVVVVVLDVMAPEAAAAAALDFFHGWNPLPTAASANGGGLFDDNLLHWAANMANGVPLNPGCSCHSKNKFNSIQFKFKIRLC